MSSAAIEFEFKGNLAQLRRDLNEASRLAKQSAAETTRATNAGQGGVANLFRRTPERRAERAFGQLGTSLATGDLATGLALFSEKLSGLGLAAGIGVGVAAGLFIKLRNDIKETEKATAALHVELSKPVALLGGLGPEGLSGQLESATKAEEKLEAASHSVGTFLRNQFFTRGGSHPLPGERAAPEPAQLAAIEERRLLIEGLRADAELKISNLKLQSVQGAEKEAALAKITLEAEEKRSELLLTRKGNTLDLFKSNLAIDVGAKAARLEVDKKFPEFHTPVTSANTDATAPIPGGRVAGVGESQELVNESESNRVNAERLNAGLPPTKSRFQDILPPGFLSNYLNDPQSAIDKSFFNPATAGQNSSNNGDSKWNNIGIGLDGIKKGVDVLNQKFQAAWG